MLVCASMCEVKDRAREVGCGWSLKEKWLQAGPVNADLILSPSLSPNVFHSKYISAQYDFKK